jgi:hypothetical protein
MIGIGDLGGLSED